MSEIDLVPVPYRRRRAFRGWLARAGTLYIAVAVLLAGLRLALGSWASAYDREIESLRVERARIEQEQRELTRLGGEQQALGQRLAVLEGLRGGVAAKEMFQVIDDSLDEEVWFRAWSFRRAGEIVDDERKAVETGYFIVLPQEAPDQPQKTWQFHTHMEINAEAEDHSALAGFVRRLAQKPEIDSARILTTKARPQDAAGGVEFELAVVVRSAP